MDIQECRKRFNAETVNKILQKLQSRSTESVASFFQIIVALTERIEVNQLRLRNGRIDIVSGNLPHDSEIRLTCDLIADNNDAHEVVVKLEPLFDAALWRSLTKLVVIRHPERTEAEEAEKGTVT